MAAAGPTAARHSYVRRRPVRIYDGTPRQDFEEVFRAIGAVLDRRGYREILLTEVPDGFLVQGLLPEDASIGGWAESYGRLVKETLTFTDDEIGRYMDEAIARRGQGNRQSRTLDAESRIPYEQALRVIGSYLDEQRPRDVFFLEQEGSFVVRLLISDQVRTRHILAEFTRGDISEMIRGGPAHRGKARPDVPAKS